MMSARPCVDGDRTDRRGGWARLVRDVCPAVAARRSGRARALPALRRQARVAPPPLHPVHVGARHRRGDLLHPSKYFAGAQYDHARVHRFRHHHGRGGAPLPHRMVAPGAHRAGRQRDGPAREADRAQLSPDQRAARLDPEQPRTDPTLSPGRDHRALVDAGRVRRHVHRRAHPTATADVGRAGSGSVVLRGGGRADDDRRRVLRSPPHLGFRRNKEIRWLRTLIVEDAKFWVVEPRITLIGVSGLGNLPSGNYIGFEVGKSTKKERRFTALEVAPVITSGQSGRQFVLKAADLGSLGVGSPIYYRRLQAGQVIAYDLTSDGKAVDLKVFVNAPYDRYVNPGTPFWNASGLDVSVGAGGAEVRTESLVAMIAGGIAFDTPA